jgi:hypothetical protein
MGKSPNEFYMLEENIFLKNFGEVCCQEPEVQEAETKDKDVNAVEEVMKAREAVAVAEEEGAEEAVVEEAVAEEAVVVAEGAHPFISKSKKESCVCFTQ